FRSSARCWPSAWHCETRAGLLPPPRPAHWRRQRSTRRQIFSHPLGRRAQPPEVRSAAERQVDRGLLVARRRLQVAPDQDALEQLLVLVVAKRALGGIA